MIKMIIESQDEEFEIDPDETNCTELIEIIQTSPGNFDPSWIVELRNFDAKRTCTLSEWQRIDEIKRLISINTDDYVVGVWPVPEGTKQVSFNNSKYQWQDLLDLPTSIEVLDLGHDGVIGFNYKINKFESKSIVIDVLKRLPNLKKIEYCGYHSHFRERDFKEALIALNRNPSSVIFRRIL
jgi:hypothetical protein